MALQQVGVVAIFDVSQFNRGQRDYTRGLRDAGRATQQFNTQINNINVSQFNSNISSTGTSLSSLGTIAGGAALAGVAALTAGLVALGAGLAESVSTAAEFEQSMAGIAAVSGTAIDDIAEVKQLALDLSIDPNLAVSATDAAGAIEMLAKNGVDLETIMNGTARSVIEMANATGEDMAQSADVATDAMAIFGITADEMTKVADNLTGVLVNSKFGLNDYALALSQGGSVAADAGISIEEFSTIIAATSSNFKSGSDAGTAFKTFLQRLQAPTGAARKELEKLGVSVFDAEGNMENIFDIFDQFNQALSETAEISETTTIGGRTEEQQKELERLQRELKSTETQLNDYATGLAGVRQSEEKKLQVQDQLTREQAILVDEIAKLEAIQGEQITTTRKLTEEERKQALVKIFGLDAIRFATAAQNINKESLLELQDAVSKEGQAAEAAATRTQTFQGAMERLKSALEFVKIQVGDLLLPTLTAFLDDAITPLIHKLPVLGKIGQAAFARLADVFGGLGAGVDLSFIDRIRSSFQLSAGIQEAIAAEDFNGVVDILLGKIQTVFMNVAEKVAGLNVGFMGGLTTGFLGHLLGVNITIGDYVSAVMGVVEPAISQIVGNVQAAFAAFQEGGTGGLVEFLGLEDFAIVAQNAANVASDFLAPIFPKLQAGALGFVAAFSPVLPQLQQLGIVIQENMPGLTALAATLGASLVVAIRAVGEAVAVLLPIIGTSLATAIEISLIWAQNFITALGALGEMFMAIAEGDLQAFIEAFNKAGEAILINILTPLRTELGQQLTNLVSLALQAGLEAFNTYAMPYIKAGMDIMINVGTGIKNGAIIAIRNMVDAMNDILREAMQSAKDFIKVGFAIMEFIGDSIWDNIGMVQGALGDVMQAAIDAALGSIGLGGSSDDSRSRSTGTQSNSSFFDSFTRSKFATPQGIGGDTNVTNVYNLNVNNSLPGATIRQDFELMRALA